MANICHNNVYYDGNGSLQHFSEPLVATGKVTRAVTHRVMKDQKAQFNLVKRALRVIGPTLLKPFYD